MKNHPTALGKHSEYRLTASQTKTLIRQCHAVTESNKRNNGSTSDSA